MALAGEALIAIWNDIAPEMREDFFEWHPREHMVERLGIPGFIRGRRYIAVDAQVEFLTLYEVANADVLVSDVYKTRLTNPTPWSTKTLPAFRNNVRGGCQIHYSQGYAMGGFIKTIRITTGNDSKASFIKHIVNNMLPGLIDLPRITGVHLVENDAALTGGNSGNQRGRVIQLPDLILMVEGSDEIGVSDACAQHLPEDALLRAGADDDVINGLYRLEYSIQNLLQPM
ncbi:hypothetical protein [Advenella mimigardefordensis]|uniref:Uncharacterized protein n=1 Tax=Advenella mimigardefordensis (strain DSM 17166 / LMG 22922 / DPN7) TaxID=1247726 RepID=W0P5W7_ADVMD|nr:hypothetical protein [Advenella mimigardefordensis]AHG62244.1 hypothetical protein MIM_c01410 [Advenella mimigardefordensis DPN7]